MNVLRNICPNCGGPTRLATDTYEQSCAACNRIAQLEAENARLRKALEHTAYYALDNVAEEVRQVAKAALVEGGIDA